MSTTPPRNVIYCNDPGFPARIAGLPYTDVILNFLAPDDNGNLSGPIPDPGDVQALQSAGKNMLISLGGDETTFPSSGLWGDPGPAPGRDPAGSRAAEQLPPVGRVRVRGSQMEVDHVQP